MRKMGTRSLWLALLSGLVASCSAGSTGSPTPPTPGPGDEVTIHREVQTAVNAFSPANDSAFIGATVSEDQVVLTYAGTPDRRPEPGDVVAGTEGPYGYLRKVVSVEEGADGTLIVHTDHATMTDLIEDGSFVVGLDPGAGEWTPSPAGGGVAGRAAALGGSLQLGEKFETDPGSPWECSAGTSIDGKVSPIFHIQPHFELAADISHHTLHTARMIVEVDVEVGAKVEISAATMAACMREWVGESEDFRQAVVLGAVPVVLTHSFAPFANVGFSFTSRIASASVEVGKTYHLRAGIAYEESDGMGWRSVWEPDATDMTTTWSVGTPGDLSLDANAGYGIRYRFRFYDTVGPELKIGPNLTAHLGLHPDCSWDANVHLGMKVEASVIVTDPFFDYELYRSPSWSRTFPAAAASDGTPGVELYSDMGNLDLPSCSDPCTAYTDCDSCNLVDGCGYCPGTGCQSDSQKDACGADWQDSPASCIDCSSYGDCTSCANNGYCGWCPSSGCQNLESSAATMCGASFARDPWVCPAP